MRYFLAFILILLVACNSDNNVTREKNQIEKRIHEFYDALAAQDFNKMKTVTTPDFILYEGGDILNKEAIVSYFKDFPKFTVQYRYDSLEIRADHDMATAHYFKTAAFVISDTQHVTVKNIETASFTKLNGEWKLELLHTSKRNENP